MILILVLVLCVPIRYDLKARYNEGFRARAGVHWLLRLLHIKAAAINAQILVKVNVFGHCLKKQHLGKWGEEENEEAASEQKPEKEPEKKEEKEEPEAEEKPPAPAQPFDAVFAEMEEEKPEEEKPGAVPEEAEDGAEDFREMIRKVEAFLDDEKNQYTIHLILKQLRKLGKHLLPTKFLIEGKLGLDDPAKTGEIIGKVYRFYPLYGDHIRLDGVYDEKVTNVYTEIAGRIRLGILVEIAVRLLLNKNFRQWIGLKKKKNKKDSKEEGQPGTQPEAAAA